MNKTRMISIIVAVVLAAVFGTGQFDRSTPSSGSPKPASSKPDSSQRQAGFEPIRRSGPNEISVDALPAEGRAVVRLIFQGGPFEYQKDGSIFQNREKRLPEKRRGFYREYTVRTPGEKTRGARRIVAGGTVGAPDVLYYTKDHYRSFLRIHGVQR